MKNYKILIVGSHRNEAALSDILSRLAWYFHSSLNLKIEIVGTGQLPEHLPQIEHFNSRTQQYYGKIKAFTSLIDSLPQTFIEYRYVLNTDHSYEIQRRSIDRIVDVDSSHSTEDSQRYIEILNEINHDTESVVVSRSREVFTRLYETIKTRNRHTNFVNLFAPGPGLSAIFDREIKVEGINVICNSLVDNTDLLTVVDPDILVFSDPIFHFGPSIYTEKFVQCITSFVERFPQILIAIPLKFSHIYINNYGVALENVIFIPSVISTHPNLNLAEGFNLKVTNNILTYMMLPIGCTFGSHINFYGFDGFDNQEITDPGLFRSNNTGLLEDNRMKAVEKIHPAFFNQSSPNYYTNHIQQLTDYIEYGGLLGFSYVNRTESYIPPLNERLHVSKVIVDEEKQTNSTLFLSICPSLASTFGHHYHQEVCIQRALGVDVDHAVLVHKDCDIPMSTLKLLPCFSNKSWEAVGEDVRKNFYIEALDAITKASERYSNVVVYQYMGSHELLDEYIKLAYAFHGTSTAFNFNFFYLCYKINTQRVVFSPHLSPHLEKKLRWSADNLHNMKLFLDNRTLQRNAEAIFSYKFHLWPHFDVTDVATKPEKNTSEKIIYYPSSLQLERGVDLLLSHLSNEEKVLKNHLKPVVRLCDPTAHQSYIKLVESELEGFPRHVEYIYGELSNEEYSHHFVNADIMVLPYRSEYFYQRTSSALIDAAKLGIPTLTSQGTWLSNIVEEYGLGSSFDEESADSFWTGVEDILHNYDKYSQNCLNSEMDNIFSPNRLVEKLSTQNMASESGTLKSFSNLFNTTQVKTIEPKPDTPPTAVLPDTEPLIERQGLVILFRRIRTYLRRKRQSK